MTPLVIATRSRHKLREIREILPPLDGLLLLDLDAAGIAASRDEDQVEAFDTFEENALAKARYFSARSGLPVLADDSGICVDALGGSPGVYSKRFSARNDLAGRDLDEANNEKLLNALRGIPVHHRTAHFACAVAFVTPDGQEEVFRGRVDGTILLAPRGSAGFGYDPLFYLPDLDASFAEVPAETKNRISHRARALRQAVPTLRAFVAHLAGRHR